MEDEREMQNNLINNKEDKEKISKNTINNENGSNGSSSSPNNNDNNPELQRKLPKILSVFFVIFFIAFFNLAHIGTFTSEVTCFYDLGFKITTGLNQLMIDVPKLQDAIMIIAGLAEDFAVVLGMMFFTFKFESWRMLFSLFIVYFLRFINQNFYLMTIPKESTFRYPGFPSLFVPYLATNDYFFSGHVSLPSVMGYEFYKNGYPKTSIFCFCVALFQMFMMFCTRGHYSIDMYAGFIFSFYSCIVINKYIHLIDKSKYSWRKENEISGIYDDDSSESNSNSNNNHNNRNDNNVVIEINSRNENRQDDNIV